MEGEDSRFFTSMLYIIITALLVPNPYSTQSTIQESNIPKVKCTITSLIRSSSSFFTFISFVLAVFTVPIYVFIHFGFISPSRLELQHQAVLFNSSSSPSTPYVS